MSNEDFAAVCASEVCERASRILVTSRDLCAEMGQPLTPDQQIWIGSCVLSAFLGVEDSIGRMHDTHGAIRAFCDERLEEWLDADD